MLTTKRYDYMPLDAIQVHPEVGNHRPLDLHKVKHYSQDILQNGLLEPLVVWEKRSGEVYLVGGFHRLAAIREIRKDHPGYFDRVDVRTVSGDLDEIRALNLKLNADRLAAKISDYFDVVLYLNDTNWSKERIAEFLDRSPSLIEDIIRYVPGLDPRLRSLLEEGKVSWSRAKEAARIVKNAPAGQQGRVLNQQLAAISRESRTNGARSRRRKPLPLSSAKKRFFAHGERHPDFVFQLKADDVASLLTVIEGTQVQETHLRRVRDLFPQLLG